MAEKYNEEFNKLLVDTFNEINRIEEKNLREIGQGDLSIVEFHVLLCISEGAAGRRTIGEIAEKMSVTHPTATVAVKRLESKGYVQRHRNETDGRSAYISLTAKGEQMNRLHRFFHEQMIFSVQAEFSEEELLLLYRCVKKLNEFFRERDNGWDFRS